MPDRSESRRVSTPASLAAVICTRNRAALLQGTLASLAEQTLDKAAYEVVVVDDGSTDDTRQVVQAFSDRLALRYAYQRHAGLGSAKNHGAFLSYAPLLLFLDDDDVASPALLEQHVESHRRYPDDNYAVLGRTTLTPELAADPLMHFVTEVGCFLYSYPALHDGDVLDFTYFWGGRTSCKRAFVLEYGLFNPVFRFGCEDIELGYRLSRMNLQVVYNAKAVSTMVRGVTFDGFCDRLVRQGRSQRVFSRLHPDIVVQKWAEIEAAEQARGDDEGAYDAIVRSARALDRMVRLKRDLQLPTDETETALLHRGYYAAFRAAKFKGIREGPQTP